MKTKIILIALTLFFLSAPAKAQLGAEIYKLAPRTQLNWYYKSGGNRPVTRANYGRRTTVRLGGASELGLGYSCGKFDPVAAIETALQNVANGADQMLNALIMQMEAIALAAPMLIAQRADPALYEFIQAIFARAELLLQFETRSCRQMERIAAAGGNPLKHIPLLAKAYDWADQQVGTSNIMVASQLVEQINGANGIPWIGGRAGGHNQNAIKLIGDTLKAGYNVLLERDTTDTAAVTGDAAASPMGQAWDSPAALEEWSKEVLGEIEVRTCDGCIPETTPGRGVQAWLEEQVGEVKGELTAISTGTGVIDSEAVLKVSAPNMGLNASTLNQLRTVYANNPTEGEAFIDSLAWGVGTSRAVSRLVMLRRVLLTGKDVPEVQGVELAKQTIEERVERIDQELSQIKLEKDLNTDLVGNVAVAITAAANQLINGAPTTNNRWNSGSRYTTQ